MGGFAVTRARRLGSLLGFAVLAGVMVAAALLPSGLLAGLATRTVADNFESLPSELRTTPASQTTYVYANDGKTLITTFYDQNRRDVRLDQVAPVMQQAIVAAEDTRFYEHGGVDLKGVVRAFVSNSSGGSEQGASTLTMQYVRNVLKNDPDLTAEERADATEDTAGRKLREIRYANALERRLSKRQILEGYLNISYFGAGAYGIFAASETYFGVTPEQLTLAQAALLAGLVQSPHAYDPINGDRDLALERRGYVLTAMVRQGDITQAEADAARAQPLVLHPHKQPNGCAALNSKHNDWGFFCDYLRQWWLAQERFGATVADRENALKTGGYTIVTSLDPGVQAEALKRSTGVYGYDSARALPIAVVTPGTGRVQALAVNRHYSLAANPKSHPTYPNTVNQLIAGGPGANGYQAGSTFKMFTMLAALEEGHPLATSFDAPSPIVTRFPDGGPGNCGGYWCPVNANPSWMNGQRTMWTGFGRSVNTYFVWLEEQIGPQKAVDMAKRLGITFRSGADARLAKNADGWGSFTLGVAATTPLDVANAYATLAANGTYCAPLPVVSIKDSSGRPVSGAEPRCSDVLDPDVAAAATDAARCPVGGQSAYGRCDGGTAAAVAGIVGRPVAGKTGSSEQNATETFVGFTPQAAAAGIAVNPDDPSDHVGSAVAASVNAAVARTLAAAVAGKPVKDFPPPSSTIALG
ncbi:transglycosylase domain-containing protein [Rhizomonospora bruguierae]|uniref:transglycosylase domain-containing protein n=1 Tax=Rhizomonospora bruguierae TaxID=1581705 RepID=UPI001BCDFD7A|nr:transglycosylase domain-containing protein [Micromonospora sp. NBRC 107566]